MAQRRSFKPEKLLILSLIRDNNLILNLYGRIFNCIIKNIDNNFISKEKVTDCIKLAFNAFSDKIKKYIDIDDKQRLSQYIAIVYNDFRRLGIITIHSANKWKKDRLGELTNIGKLIKSCANQLDDSVLGSLIVTLCRNRPDLLGGLRRDEAGFCFKNRLEKDEEKLLKVAEKIVNNVDIYSLCPNLQIKHLSIDKFKDTTKSFLDVAILSVLVSGKNLLLLGSPGTGKTSYVIKLLTSLGISYTLETGNPEWTPFDVVGGMTLSGWRDGFLTKIIKNYKHIHWLIIDEFNRANIDLSFGKYFTMLDIEHRDQVIEIEGRAVRVPYSFRVVGTLNSYDKGGLYKLGYALMRRFSVVNFDLFNNDNFKEVYQRGSQGFIKFLKDGKTGCDLKGNIDLNRVLEVLLRFDGGDYVMLNSTLRERLEGYRENVFKVGVEGVGEVDVSEVAICLAGEINKKLAEFNTCDICPVYITPGVVADILRYLAALRVLCDVLQISASWCLSSVEGFQRHLDFAFSTYAVPQLSVLSNYIQLEGYDSAVGRIVSDIANWVEGIGLAVTSTLFKRLSRGYAVP